MSAGWMFFWLFVFADLGFALGWATRGLMYERQEDRDEECEPL